MLAMQLQNIILLAKTVGMKLQLLFAIINDMVIHNGINSAYKLSVEMELLHALRDV